MLGTAIAISNIHIIHMSFYPGMISLYLCLYLLQYCLRFIFNK